VNGTAVAPIAQPGALAVKLLVEVAALVRDIEPGEQQRAQRGQRGGNLVESDRISP